jgi:predicted acetyltransferase
MQREFSRVPADLEFIKLTQFVDGDLTLRFIAKGQTSPPDKEIRCYQFEMVQTVSEETMGKINLRAGYTENIQYYRGNIGFTVFERFRGHHFSARSCLLLKPLIQFLKLHPIWLTCNADNYASQKNLEMIGAQYLETITMPADSPYITFYPPEARVKRRYQWEIRSM